jgi:hypothetical protein
MLGAPATAAATAATSVCGLKLLVYDALRNDCMRPETTSGEALHRLLVYEALSY